jgi:hypothetical protein
VEMVIAELSRAHRRAFDASLPPIAGPRALLRAQLEKLSAHESGFVSSARFWIGRFVSGYGLVGFAAVAVVTCVLAFVHSNATKAPPPVFSSNLGILPNRDFTPGVARAVSFQKICAMAHEEVVKEVPPSQRQRVFEEYGIPASKSDQYEVDYLITPGLGGDDDIRNLWPEPYHSADWNAHLKDDLEERLHEMVCSNQLDLSVAQQAIATNWIAAYQKYVAAPQSTATPAKEL